MGAKIRTKDIDNWLRHGDTDSLAMHWTNSIVRAYRQEKIDSVYGKTSTTNEWTRQTMNGATFVFLLNNDTCFKKHHQAVRKDMEHWSDLFYDKCWTSSWNLLDVARGPLHNTDAVNTLHLLSRDGHMPDGLVRYNNKLRAKLHNEMHDFYKRFQNQYALTALACFDNDTVWTGQKPMMANLMQHAAKHYPHDVFGAYLMWACDVHFETEENVQHDPVDMRRNNAARMEQLCLLAKRVGLDTSDYANLAAQCKTLHQGLGLPLSPQNIMAYAQALAVPIASIGDEPISNALFV